MRNLLQDLRFALRQLRASPAFAITAVLSITLGIGATTAIFSVVYGVLVDPYPYKDAYRMVHVELRQKDDRGPLLVVNGAEYQELKKASTIDNVFLQKNETHVCKDQSEREKALEKEFCNLPRCFRKTFLFRCKIRVNYIYFNDLQGFLFGGQVALLPA